MSEIINNKIKQILQSIFKQEYMDSFIIDNNYNLRYREKNVIKYYFGSFSFHYNNGDSKTFGTLGIPRNTKLDNELNSISLVLNREAIDFIQALFIDKNLYINYQNHLLEIKKLSNLIFPNTPFENGFNLMITEKDREINIFFRNMIVLYDPEVVELKMPNNKNIWHGDFLKKSIQNTVLRLVNVNYELNDINIKNLEHIGLQMKALRY